MGINVFDKNKNNVLTDVEYSSNSYDNGFANGSVASSAAVNTQLLILNKVCNAVLKNSTLNIVPSTSDADIKAAVNFLNPHRISISGGQYNFSTATLTTTAVANSSSHATIIAKLEAPVHSGSVSANLTISGTAGSFCTVPIDMTVETGSSGAPSLHGYAKIEIDYVSSWCFVDVKVFMESLVTPITPAYQKEIKLESGCGAMNADVITIAMTNISCSFMQCSAFSNADDFSVVLAKA